MNNVNKELTFKVKDRLDIMLRILIHADESLKIVEYLYDENGQTPSVRIAKNIDIFFNTVKINFYRVTIIELYKLHKESEEYSIPNLLKKFNKQKKFESLSKDIDVKFINDTLNNQDSNIKYLFTTRNKHYAHLDKKYSSINVSIDFQKIRNLLNTTQIIYNYLTNNLLGNPAHYFNFPMGNPLESLELLMEKLVFYDENTRM